MKERGEKEFTVGGERYEKWKVQHIDRNPTVRRSTGDDQYIAEDLRRASIYIPGRTFP